MNFAETFPVGEFILDELDAREWTQSNFAIIAGIPLNVLGGIINGKQNITPEIAKKLGKAFGTSAEYWINLDGNKEE